MTRLHINESVGYQIWNILVKDGGAFDRDNGDSFVRYAVQKQDCTFEWRFQGHLGFGGKFWQNQNRWYVNAYPEDVKKYPLMQTVIDQINAKLDALRSSANYVE